MLECVAPAAAVQILVVMAAATAATLPALAAPVALTSIGSPLEGTWRTLNGTEVSIAPCDQGFCGTLSWVVIPKEFSAQCEQDKAAFGAQMLDLQNPDASLKARPVVGMMMMTLRPSSDPKTFTANIYNAQDGKNYDGVAWVINGDSTLRLGGGCMGSICAMTQDWPRVPVREGPPDFTCQPQ